jgi:protease-4
MKKQTNKWGVVITVLIALGLLSFLLAGIIKLFVGVDSISSSGNVALIPIKGMIVPDGDVSAFGSSVASSTKIVKSIERAAKNPSIKAVIFEINSGGGTPVASDEIASAIKLLNKTTVAWIREVGASGAYWIASACDIIVANRMSITGSFGVRGSYLEFSGLLHDYNITYQRLVGGKYKDMGSPFRRMTEEEEDILQGLLDTTHDYFIEEIAANRNLPKKRVRSLAEGQIFLGSQAKEFGLVDYLGGKQEVIELIENKLNITTNIVEYKEKKTLFGLLSQVLNEQSFFIGRGIGSSLFDTRNTVDNLHIDT